MRNACQNLVKTELREADREQKGFQGRQDEEIMLGEHTLISR